RSRTTVWHLGALPRHYRATYVLRACRVRCSRGSKPMLVSGYWLQLVAIVGCWWPFGGIWSMPCAEEHNMAKSINDRVRASFSSDDRDSLKYYLDSTITASKSYADGMRRSATFMLVLIAVFELLVGGVVKQVTIGPFVFTGITTILAFAPSAI